MNIYKVEYCLTGNWEDEYYMKKEDAIAAAKEYIINIAMNEIDEKEMLNELAESGDNYVDEVVYIDEISVVE